MPEVPRITIAVPTYQGARHVRSALESILSQGEDAFDLLIVDDRSEDETLSIVREVAGDRARIVVNTERLGLAGNWNRCVTLARTEWVNLFHQDDLMGPGHIAAHVGRIALSRVTRDSVDAESRLGMIAGPAEPIDEEGRPVPVTIVERGGLDDLGRDVAFPPGAFLRELAVGNPVRCSAVTLNRSVHQALGGFDPSYRYVVDWEFWIRLARGHAVAWLATPTVAFRWHEASETHRFRHGTIDLDEQVQLLDRLHESSRIPDEDVARFRPSAKRRLARAYLNRAYEASRARDAALVRRCLRRSLGLWPGVAGSFVRDPRLTARLLLGLLSRRTPSEE